MNILPVIAVRRTVAAREVLSARPGSPVVPARPAAVRRPRLEGRRASLADALHRTADRVAPPACGTAS